ncbi:MULTISPECIES: alkaline phosphatase family protein [Pseudomonas]|jgi:hypothetical protein|uniref:Alkaline phosphatase family protein n=1 Tax=Pseudomonas fluorescens TaxID=294 RepID=A0A5E7VKF8_PSEFL|nr:MULTISPECIES: alkaline phosphatase family protein [Pseudomonas]OPK07766.1 hypothetical protein BZ163_25600 [Pseudomonas sp. VI4.1]VVQ23199.1 hypothetical protein PS928_05481 [Pseudomonas fluorescens]
MSQPIRSGLASLTNSVLQSLGAGDNAAGIVLPRCKQVVLCLVDGLGAQLLDRYAHRAPYLSSRINRGEGQVLRSGFPSTTAASLASLATAEDSGSHGIVGAAFNVEGWQFNPLSWQLFDPRTGRLDAAACAEEIVASQSAWVKAAADGLLINAFLPAAIAGSAYTRAVFNGANVIAFTDPDDLIANVRSVSACNDRQLSYVYFGELDLCGHLHGPGSEKWQDTLEDIDRRIRSLRDQIEQDALLIVTADHGMTTIEEARTFDFDLMPDLQRGVASICGDIRARHVYLQDPTDADVVKRWRDILAGHSVLTREQALVLGLFGKNMTDAACRRIGDLLLIAGDNAGLVRSVREPFQTSWTGHHGALSDEEQLVPLIVATGG